MTKTNLLKKPAPKDRHKAVIKAALEKKGWTLRGMSTFNSLIYGAERAALDSNSSIVEEVIAALFGCCLQTPKEICVMVKFFCRDFKPLFLCFLPFQPVLYIQ